MLPFSEEVGVGPQRIKPQVWVKVYDQLLPPLSSSVEYRRTAPFRRSFTTLS